MDLATAAVDDEQRTTLTGALVAIVSRSGLKMCLWLPADAVVLWSAEAV